MRPQRTRVGWWLPTPGLRLSKPTPEEPSGLDSPLARLSTAAHIHRGRRVGSRARSPSGSVCWEERECTMHRGLGSALLGLGGLVARLAAGPRQQHRIRATRESCPPARISDSDS